MYHILDNKGKTGKLTSFGQIIQYEILVMDAVFHKRRPVCYIWKRWRTGLVTYFQQGLAYTEQVKRQESNDHLSWKAEVRTAGLPSICLTPKCVDE